MEDGRHVSALHENFRLYGAADGQQVCHPRCLVLSSRCTNEESGEAKENNDHQLQGQSESVASSRRFDPWCSKGSPDGA